MLTFDKQVRPLKLAWALSDLIGDDGYCWGGNPFLSKITGLAEAKITGAFLELQTAGAIIRASCLTEAKRRRIYLSKTIVEAVEKAHGPLAILPRRWG